jgi:hypothetical protein
MVHVLKKRNNKAAQIRNVVPQQCGALLVKSSGMVCSTEYHLELFFAHQVSDNE